MDKDIRDVYIHNARPRKRDGDRECDKEGNKHTKKCGGKKKTETATSEAEPPAAVAEAEATTTIYPTPTYTNCHGIIPSHPVSLFPFLSRSVPVCV